MKVPTLVPFGEWKKTPVAGFTEEEKKISLWKMNEDNRMVDSRKNISYWLEKWEELFIQPTDGVPMAIYIIDIGNYTTLTLHKVATLPGLGILHLMGMMEPLIPKKKRL